MNTNANPIEFGATNRAMETPADSAHSLARAHADRSYPDAARPKSPSHAKLYDEEKERCFQARLRIETERQNTPPETTPYSPPSHSSHSSHDSHSASLPHLPYSSPPPPTSAQPSTSPSLQEKNSPAIPVPNATTPPPQELPNRNEPQQGAINRDATATTRDQAQSPANQPQLVATPSHCHSHPDLNHNSYSSYNSHDPHPTTIATASSSLPVLAESQDNFELLFDPAVPFEVHAKRRSPLDRLPPEHQEIIIDLIREHPLQTVADLLARPLPYGVNLQTTPTALSRFSHRYIAARDKREREQKILTAQEMMSGSENPTAVFNQLSSHLLQMRILATSSESDPDLKDLHTLVNCLTKLRRQSLAERTKGGIARAASNGGTPRAARSRPAPCGPPNSPVGGDVSSL